MMNSTDTTTTLKHVVDAVNHEDAMQDILAELERLASEIQALADKLCKNL